MCLKVQIGVINHYSYTYGHDFAVVCVLTVMTWRSQFNAAMLPLIMVKNNVLYF